MPRMDTGDAFDRILQRWLDNGADSIPRRQSQQVEYRGMDPQLTLLVETSLIPALLQPDPG